MSTVIVQQGQTIIDICIQIYGTPLAMLELHTLNNFESIPMSVQAGDIITVAPELSQHTNKKQLKAMQAQSVATSIINNIQEPQGIGHWAIEAGFKIS